MSDQVFFDFLPEKITITNTRFIVNNETYILRNITSIKTNVIEGKKGRKPYTVQEMREMKYTGSCMLLVIGIITIPIIIGLFIIIGAFALLFSKQKDEGVPDEPNTYELILKTSGGEIKAFVTKDKDLMDNIVAALNDAIAYGS